jgi:UDP-N-acetylmuramyl pentapeptide phosphotransferase/UDP-N-acetylglucosamine-1-phosphate transferase
MIEISYIIILISSILLIEKLFQSKNFLQSQSGERHQKFVENQSVPLIGGFYFAITFSIIFYETDQVILSSAITSIFILGLISDLKLIRSPKIRFIFQTIIIFFFAYLFELKIVSTRIPFFDNFLQYEILNFLFVIFCTLILINGTNFIDGLNGLVIGYFTIISIALYSIGLFDDLNFTSREYIIFFSLMILMFLFNIFNKLYLGDSGAYTVGLTFSFLIIKYHEKFSSISPYFIILLLWYPCFENLFSIIRKSRFKRSPMHPDENHLHQMLFFFIKKKFKLKNIHTNNLSSSIILSFNMIIIYVACQHLYSTKVQIIILLIAVLSYIFSYITLFNFKYKVLQKLS